MQTMDCTVNDREALVRSYVSGRISEAEAEAFEQHFLGCEKCLAAVKQALEIRAALQSEPAGGVERPAAIVAKPTEGRFRWRWLAAAAMVVIATAVWRFGLPGRLSSPDESASPRVTSSPTPSSVPAQDVLRAPSVQVTLTATRLDNGRFRFSWTAHPQAVRYVLKVFAQDGTPVLTREITGLTVDLKPGELGNHAQARLLARVDAFDALGVNVGASSRIEFHANK